MHEVHWTKLKLTYLLIVDSWAPLPKNECLQKALLFQYLLPPINHRLHFLKHNNTFPFCCTGKCSLAHLKEKYTLHREYVSFLSQLVTFTIEWDLPIVREEKHIPDVRYNFSHLSGWYAHNCQYCTICDTYYIVCKKFCIISAYRKCLWIVWYNMCIV